MLWTQFAEQEPELALRGQELLAEEHGYVYLSTVSADGGPRLHPVAPVLSDRGLYVAVTRRSPKLADVRAEPRVALHSNVLPPDDEEFSVRGVVREVEDEDAREAAVAGARGGARLSDALALFEVDLVEVGWSRWSEGKPTRRRWRASGGPV
ncbi:pyridoxamine 5'-phosphate oxidase family protein [Streptomyces cellulosae]|uniref:pyridoxamine 5'-phosphate oxidase family protein n=1 Tax=Streptomyces cellulosae TaxID=1968 RepID=UPI00068DE021|nr:pyridoxamine 5'-phosphate oxidase family protein [Streptomyces cellulosae]